MVESFAIELSLMAADAIETSMKHAASLVVSVVKFKCIMAAKDGRTANGAKYLCHLAQPSGEA